MSRTSNDQILIGKSIALGTNTVTGTKAQFNTAVTDGDIVYLDSIDTITGVKTFATGTLVTTKPVINGTNPTGATYTPATGAQTVALDCASNDMHIVVGNVVGTAITFTIANVTNNQSFKVSILQGATTVSTITGWFATVRWAGGVAPMITALANKRDTFEFIRTGVDTYDGFIVGQNC